MWERVLEGLRVGGWGGYVLGQLGALTPIAVDEKAFTLGYPDPFFRDWVAEHYGRALQSALENELGMPIEVKYESVGTALPPPLLSPSSNTRFRQRANRLNSSFTFESYVVSGSNELPWAAAFAVADSPGRAYNPLFIHGGTGLGKTHLLHAIGNHILDARPGAQVKYLSSEEFTNQFIESLRDHRMAEFRRRFREECDVLLIDDIQFLGKKQETQNEFFYTFNALHQMSKAVVMTSDIDPKKIPGLEERLRSRFAMGLIADVHEPNFEARVAILKKKAERDGIEISDEVAQLIARSVVTNVRELEGALIKVLAVHSLTKQPLSEELCAQVLDDVTSGDRRVDAERIQMEVARYYKLEVGDLVGERRIRSITHARQVAMYLCRTMTQASLPEIGKKFNKDHSTVLSSVRKIEQLKDEQQLKLELVDIGNKLTAS